MAGYITHGHEIMLDARQTIVGTLLSTSEINVRILVQRVLSFQMEKAEQK